MLKWQINWKLLN